MRRGKLYCEALSVVAISPKGKWLAARGMVGEGKLAN